MRALAVVCLLGAAAPAMEPDASECATCHADVAAQWSRSAHHFSSFNNPYYRVSVEEFRRERGAAASRFCARCHEPLLVPTIERAIDPKSAAAQAGIVCLVCHSIESAPLDGNGLYRLAAKPWTITRPEHAARLRPALLAEAQLCGSCHKVGLDREVTHDRWLRGQDDYDAWQASASSGNGAGAVFRPSETRTCQGCHMPLEPAVLGDAAAKNGQIRSHRFLGANAALAHQRGDADTGARVAAFLDGAVALDAAWSGAERVDVVIANRRVGHRFPGGTNDSNEVWLEVEARDATGALLGRSGGLDESGALDAEAHLVRAQPVDSEARPLERRDPQHMRGVAFDSSLAPAEPQVVRFVVPAGTARVRARLLYRKFSAAYARRACALVPRAERARCEAVPIVEVARAAIDAGAPDADDWRRLTARGLGLSGALVDTASEAEPLLERARALAPLRPEPLLGLARLMLRLGRTDDAVSFAERARRLDPTHPAADFYAATALLDAYRHEPARAIVERLLTRLPADRHALSLAARIRGLGRDSAAALEAADRLIAIDPFLDEGWYQRALALVELGRADEAEQAEGQYLGHRVASEIDLELRRAFRARRASLADESIPVHAHRLRPSKEPR